MKTHEILNENVEDQHADVYSKFKERLENIGDPKEKSRIIKNMSDAMDTFSNGYENDNDNLMYGGLGDMEDIVSRMPPMNLRKLHKDPKAIK